MYKYITITITINDGEFTCWGKINASVKWLSLLINGTIINFPQLIKWLFYYFIVIMSRRRDATDEKSKIHNSKQ